MKNSTFKIFKSWTHVHAPHKKTIYALYKFNIIHLLIYPHYTLSLCSWEYSMEILFKNLIISQLQLNMIYI